MAPDPEAVEIADAAAARIQSYLTRHDSASVVVLGVAEDGEDLTLPRDALVLLARVLAYMANGQAVSVVPTHAELTTQQAADLLNVSRPYLIGLLEAGEIEFRKVGSHRRVRMQSLMDYKRKDDARRREAADALSAESRELGLE
ncbi:MAG TPA: helix-turn-helix domain-containing protein [Mycobacteriales bacterium]